MIVRAKVVRMLLAIITNMAIEQSRDTIEQSTAAGPQNALEALKTFKVSGAIY